MALGPTMRLKTKNGLSIELTPFARSDVQEFVGGFAHDSVLRFISLQHQAQTTETCEEWYDKIIHDKERIVWGIWVVDGQKKLLVGNTALMNFEREPLFQATSGIVITAKNFWGKGIASAAHKARTWYAFKQLGLVRIKSAVVHGNNASLAALQKVGYSQVYIERNTKFIDGTFKHQDNLECLNPDDWAWRQWWGDDRPTRKAIEARDHTRTVLDWADQNIVLL